MAKSLVKQAHYPNPAVNGEGGCFARTSSGGNCPGIQTAAWLNGLGDDAAPYMRVGGRTVTNFDVRQNWVRSSGHIVWVHQPVLQPCPECGGSGKVVVPDPVELNERTVVG